MACRSFPLEGELARAGAAPPWRGGRARNRRGCDVRRCPPADERTTDGRHATHCQLANATKYKNAHSCRPGPRPAMGCYNCRTMATKPGGNRRSEYDVIEPIGERVVIRKDENKRETRSGIVLPDSHEIPVITGRVIAVSKQIENDDDQTIRQYDKVLFDPREAIPVELEHDNKLFVVSLDRVLAIFRRSDVKKPSEES